MSGSIGITDTYVFSSVKFEKRSTFILVSSVKQASSNHSSDVVIMSRSHQFMYVLPFHTVVFGLLINERLEHIKA